MTTRLLVVDDEPRITRLVKRVAEDLGFDVLAICDPLQFSESYLNFKPDIIVLDLRMQQIDGVEMLRYLAEQRSKSGVFVMSGVDCRVINTAERLGQSLSLNMLGAILKPFDNELLRKHLVRAATMPTAQKIEAGQQVITAQDLADAIENDQLYLNYQPKVDLHSGVVHGVESLARWEHPVQRAISPVVFIPVAESNGLIEQLTYHFLHRMLIDTASWPEYAKRLNIAVNLSAKLLESVDLPDRIASMLNEFSFPPEQLTLEITESLAISLSSLNMDILTRLRLKGIQLAIDDLGTGYSSLEQLYNLPYGELKIDKSFVSAAQHHHEARTMVQSITQLGHGLGLSVVAEGIEDLKTVHWLRKIGCDIGQGYYFSRPLKSGQLPEWLEAWQRRNDTTDPVQLPL